jgi:hypothetical protein
MLQANATTLCVFAIGILSLGCENSDGNAIVAAKPTQHANTLKSGRQKKMLSDLTSFNRLDGG